MIFHIRIGELFLEIKTQMIYQLPNYQVICIYNTLDDIFTFM